MVDRLLDEQFAHFARTGDVEALEFVFTRCRDRLQRRARRWVGDGSAAEDLVQELFLALFVHGTKFDVSRPCLPFLVGALHRRATTWKVQRARRARHARHESAPAPRADDAPPSAAVERELRRAVREALSRLTPANQEVVARFFESHETPPEIARALGRPVGTVRVQLHRGLRQLRDALPKGVFALPLFLMLRPADAHAVPRGFAARSARGVRWSAAAAVVLAAGALAIALSVGGGDAPSASVAPVVREVAQVPATLPGAHVLAREAAPAVLADAVDAEWTVRFASGEPAAGVVVRLDRAGRDADFHSTALAADAAGQVAFRGLAAGEYYVLTDRGTATSCVLERGGTARRTIDLPRGVEVRGRVVDNAGRPVPGAGIWLSQEPGVPWEGRVVAHAADDGTFALRDLATMSTFGAIAPGRVPSPVRSVPSFACDGVELRIGDAAAAIAGTVVDEHGAPVAGAIVRAARHVRSQVLLPGGERWLELHPSLACATGADGTFACTELPLGRLEVCVRSPVHAARLAIVHTVAGATVPLRVVLRPGVAIGGSLCDPEGTPIADAEVIAHGPAHHQWAGVNSARDGSFVLEGLDPLRIVVAASAAGFAPRSVAVPAFGPGPVELELAPLRTVRGRFVGTDGGVDAGRWELGARARRADDQGHKSPEPVSFAADGAFATAVAGEVEFFCRPSDDRVWLRCERCWRGELLELRPPAAHAVRGVLSVRLHGASDEQRADAHVWVTRDDEVYRGRPVPGASLERLAVELPVGDYVVYVIGAAGRCPPYDAGRVRLTSDGATVDVTIGKHGTLDYSLLGEHGAPERCRAFVVDERGGMFPLHTTLGRVALAAGRYQLWASGLAFMTARGVPFAIRDGETTTLSVPLRAAVVRHVAFRLPPGVPEHELTSTIACRGALVVGGELGVHDRGFESTADGAGIVTAMLAADEYTLRVVAGTRRFAGKFALAGDDGVGEPVWVELHEEAGGG